MNGEKDALKSNGMWGFVGALIIWANNAFGLGLGEMLVNIGQAIVDGDTESVGMGLFLLWGVIGRFTAKTRITSIFGWKFVKEESKE